MRPPANPGPNIDAVRRFWDSNPLWTGEATAPPGTRLFFEEHRRTIHSDCYAGMIDERIFPPIDKASTILDLGCGVGFWLVEFWERGFSNITGADLSPRSLEIARQRCAIYGVKAELSVQNAEATKFPAQIFDHVNCQGVIHHTPAPSAALREIHRILRPGGTASISVYYLNALLRHWPLIRPFSHFTSRLGGGLKGRGREEIMAATDVDDIVRRYDGDGNPLGRAYSRKAFAELLGPGFQIEQMFFHFFPARALPFKVPQLIHRVLDRSLPFMIYANVGRI